MSVVVLGIAGGTGSGKTTVTRAIVQSVGEEHISYLEHDSYYKDLSHLPLEERRKVNFDHPSAFDTALLVEHIEALRAGRAVEVPVYSYVESARIKGESHRVEPRPLIVVEGILTLENQALRGLMDVKIFVDTDDDIRLMRRLRRDTQERGRTVEHVLGQYEATVRPMHIAFVHPSRRHADVIIPRGGRNVVAIEMVADSLKRKLGKLRKLA
ncbi:uridine kinase [Myxococcota bacterium]|nr:uridine kinase [Myxococcota bacterium]